MIEYKMPVEVSRLIAVGVYQSISSFLKDADSNDYAQFKANYERKKAEHAPASVKRRPSRKRPAQLR